MGFDDGDDDGLTDGQREALARCEASFAYFLQYWTFTDRESGTVTTFATLWAGQQEFVELMARAPWIFALKAGKLGFTELECAYDGWVARFAQPNARVHLFSRDARAAQDLLSYVRFGLTHLPEWMRLPILSDASGGDTAMSLKFRAGPDDVRTVVSYAAGQNVAIDQTATHSHVDELAHMLFAEQTWSALSTAVAPGGTCHIVTRGAGDSDYVPRLWAAAESGESKLVPFFAPWDQRPDRDHAWREREGSTLSLQALLHYLPETPADALAGDETAIYIPLDVWDLCFDSSLPPLEPGDGTAIVLGVDGAVSGDQFAVVAVSRHPDRHSDPAIRACKVWKPSHRGGHIDFEAVERFIRVLCGGGCAFGHPKAMPDPRCAPCARGDYSLPKHRVVQVTYDPYQMEDMAQRFVKDGVAWMSEFSQTTERLIADSLMHKLALRGALAHNGDEDLREHISNAMARLSKDEDSQMRIVKKSPERKIDLAVAASMAIKRILELNV